VTDDNARFAIREATPRDAVGIARAHVESWQTSYRGILPDDLLDTIDVGQRVASRERILAKANVLCLVAYDVTHGDIVGFCDAGPSRRARAGEAEVYAIYLVHRAKRYGLGRTMLERSMLWLAGHDYRSMLIWVLSTNHHARRFYEALGGRAAEAIQTTVGGVPVVEQAYVWDRI
jgi:GNAT superfamily N-acetyltransferase